MATEPWESKIRSIPRQDGRGEDSSGEMKPELLAERDFEG